MIIVEAKTALCPECGKAIKPTDLLLKIDGKIISHMRRELFDAIKEIAEKKGITFDQYFEEAFRGMMVQYLAKEL